MIVKDEKKSKMCSFYVSDYHLEMILLPYINEKIEKNEEITILTQKNLTESINVLLSKMNLKEENRNKILNLGWNCQEKELNNNSNIIIIGSENYIKNQNTEIEKLKLNSPNIVDCYDFEEVKDRISSIVSEYENNLNTLGNDKF